MSRIKTLLVGIFVVGAGRAISSVDEAIRDFMGAQYEPPLDLAMLVDTASIGLIGLGGLMVAYAVLATLFHVLKGALTGRGGNRQRQPRRQPQGQQGGNRQPRQGSQQQRQQQPRQQQGQQRQYQQRQRRQE